MPPAAAPRRNRADPESAPPTQRRDRDRTRQRILVCASAEFAKHGFDGARVDRMVERLKVSKSLIYHYFKSKEQLFIAVMELAYEKMRARHQDFELRGMEPVEAMARLVSYTFQHFVDHPEIISLLNSENLYKAKHIAKSPIIGTMYNPFLENLSAILAHGQEQGIFRRDVDPVELYISISGLGYFYLSNRYTLGAIFHRKLDGATELCNRHQHVIDVILGYLRYQGESITLPMKA